MTPDEINEARWDGDGPDREDAVMEEQAIARGGATATTNRPDTDLLLMLAGYHESKGHLTPLEASYLVAAADWIAAQPAPVPSYPSSDERHAVIAVEHLHTLLVDALELHHRFGRPETYLARNAATIALATTAAAPSAPVPAEPGEPDTMKTITPTDWNAGAYSDDTEWPWWSEGGDAISWAAIVYHWPGEYEHWTWELVSPDCEAAEYLLDGTHPQDPTPFLQDIVNRLHSTSPMDVREVAVTTDADPAPPVPAEPGRCFTCDKTWAKCQAKHAEKPDKWCCKDCEHPSPAPPVSAPVPETPAPGDMTEAEFEAVYAAHLRTLAVNNPTLPAPSPTTDQTDGAS